MRNINNNIFFYGRSELTQDAFICWFLSHLLKNNSYCENKIQQCAREFMKQIIHEFENNDYIDEILKQVNNIDVLIKAKNKYIIIEDKTFTDTHNDQINRYRNKLIENGVKQENIICVYYKIMNQLNPEQDVDCEFTREDLLNIFKKYVNDISNAIFLNYYEYLCYIEERVNSYKTEPIAKWDRYSFIGMFTELKDTILKNYNPNWFYVSNKSGGFMGMCWHGLSDELITKGISNDIINELYPQIENNIIAIKMTAGSDENKRDIATDYRWEFFKYFREKLGNSFTKKRFREGTYMTIGYIEYNETNYTEIINKVNQAIYNLLGNIKL